MKCAKCGAELVARPVPGAKQFPRRLECPEHGWQQEKLRPIRMRFHKDRPQLVGRLFASAGMVRPFTFADFFANVVSPAIHQRKVGFDGVL